MSSEKAEVKRMRREWLKTRLETILRSDPEISQGVLVERLAARPEALKAIAAELGLKIPGRKAGLKMRGRR